MAGELKIFGGRAHPALVQEICEYLHLEAGHVKAVNFSDGEIFCQVTENVRGSDVFVVQPTCEPVNENLMELLILLDTFKRSSASRVTAVIPYYGYARQDKKDQPRVPITAKLVADLISRAGADRVLTLDLHADQIQGFFDVPVDHLFAAPVLLEAMKAFPVPDLVIVSPDAGGVERARAIAKRLGVGLAIVDKRRTAPNEAEVMHIIGDVDGKNALIVDDIIDTAGTLTKTVEALRMKGAERILAAGVHGVLSGPALDRINASPLESVLITNTIPVEAKLARSAKLRTLSVASLLGEAIRRIHENSSVSSLFV
ncbi:MAG TPA: ribose-phosphate pyrophosphokinase [Thermoanaerobaculia bacterium]|jgi:ribose-phosphate pyrophosphokinase|nr:ribose-phosphate pyrophosphokinase [Thermoanaerobaculia bacterium]